MSKLEKSEQDDDYEEEEVLIYMDVDTYVSQKEIMDKDVQIKILGIDKKRPIMQISNRIFEGEYSLALGTNVFFHEDFQNKADPVFSKSKTLYKYFDSTNKVLKMTRISISEKNSQMEEMPEETEATENSKYKVTKTYQESLNLFLDPGQPAPRDIPEPENGRSLVTNGNSKNIQSQLIDDDPEPDDKVKDQDYIPKNS